MGIRPIRYNLAEAGNAQTKWVKSPPTHLAQEGIGKRISPGEGIVPVPSTADRSMLYGVTVSGKVSMRASDRGTPTWSMLMRGSGVITVRALKSTRLPIRLPRMRPSLPLRRWLIDLMGLPLRCCACGQPRKGEDESGGG